MKLVDVYAPYTAVWVLYELLREREPHESISHKRMPSLGEHNAFVNSRPYAAWYLVEDGRSPVGACYLTHAREIGVGILKAHRGRGLGAQAVQELMRLHPGRFLANINPANERSLTMFRALGFAGPIQVTLEKP